MLYGILLTIFVINALLMGILIMIQKSKSSTGLGNMGGGVQMLFGGSGGQDIFQKLTWIMATIFMLGSVVLGVMKTRQSETSRYLEKLDTISRTSVPQTQPAMPTQPNPSLPQEPL